MTDEQKGAAVVAMLNGWKWGDRVRNKRNKKGIATIISLAEEEGLALLYYEHRWRSNHVWASLSNLVRA